MHKVILLAADLTTTAVAATAATAQTDVPLIAREKIFGNPSRVNGRLSPDGKWLSWIAPRDGVLNIHVAPAADAGAAKPLTNERQRPIRQYFWSPDSRQILFINDKGGDENFLLYGLDVASGAQRTLTPFEKTRVQVLGTSNAVKDRILVGINNRDPRWHDVYSLDLATAKLTPVLINKGGYSSFLADEQLRIRAATKARQDGGSEFYRVTNNVVEATPFEQVTLEDSQTTAPAGFTKDGKTLYWLDSRGRDTAALIAQNVASGRKSVIAENAKADISSALSNPATGRVEAYAVNYLKTEWTPLDPKIKRDLDFLKSRLKGEFAVTSRTDADDRWIVADDPVVAPSTAYLYDRKAQSLTKLYTTRPELEGAPLAAMYPREIKTRDGMTMVSYLTLPPGSDADGDGRPEKPVPLVLLVHGGPWGRDAYGYNGTHQWLANRGYAVLSPNFRASTGFGKKFISAGDLQWGTKMHDDLIDAVDWAIAGGVTSADKVAIMGGSYGGYATLAGLAFTPDKFACGVDIVGPSNLQTLLQTIPPYWTALRTQFYKRMGDPTTAEGLALLKERSPLYKADQIRKPLLIGQGANDPRVNVKESEQIVEAMKAKNIPVTYVVFPDEGHGFARPVNNIAFNAVAENFLANCLGGRAEPIGDTLKASTAQVQHGAEFAPGLAEAIGSR
ncbi:S9 family peptidase [Sphingosinicella sp. BN140058]|uniref:S9 family peptidase n=1 Tax=Sphingosinicella sp. BN140058 TaxID=1892855 RepID=UPI0010110C5E|nr:S9 family peptidase [Sphingosinicella sp. BN140058]QAY76583.1 S9 family peptidase [Sphingosinicella sp. BN140058]